jgi:hypothetical protein
MKYVICKDMDEFSKLDKQAVEVWNVAFPKGQCEVYATPKIHPVDGRIAFPCDEQLNLGYPSAAELDDDWFLPSDAAEREQVLAKRAHEAALSSGYDTGLGYSISVAERSQNRFGAMMTGLKNIAPPNETEVAIWDQEKVKHVVTYAQFKTIMQGYAMRCMGIEQ